MQQWGEEVFGNIGVFMFTKGTGQSLYDNRQPCLQPCKVINKKVLSQLILCPGEVWVKATVHPNNKRKKENNEQRTTTHFSISLPLVVR